MKMLYALISVLTLHGACKSRDNNDSETFANSNNDPRWLSGSRVANGKQPCRLMIKYSSNINRISFGAELSLTPDEVLKTGINTAGGLAVGRGAVDSRDFERLMKDGKGEISGGGYSVKVTTDPITGLRHLVLQPSSEHLESFDPYWSRMDIEIGNSPIGTHPEQRNYSSANLTVRRREGDRAGTISFVDTCVL